MQTYNNYINGSWIPAHSGETFVNINPANTKEEIGYFASSNEFDVKRAIAAATETFKTWKHSTPAKRGEILYKAANWLEENADKIAEELTREEGKPLRDARGEVLSTVSIFRFYAGLSYLVNGETFPSDQDLLLYTKRVPLGVVAVITPWNFPMVLAGRKLASAIASGNTIVFKPSSDTPLMGVRLVEAFEVAGLPAGVCNMITGSASKVATPLITDPNISAVTFTGSTRAGFSIQRQVSPTCRTQLEMGGKNALVVLKDADIDRAVTIAVNGAFNLSGQVCTGTSRILVEKEIYDQFLESLVDAVSNINVGNGLDDNTRMGPLANSSQQDQFLSYIHIGVEEGAKLEIGGKKLEGGQYDNGYYVSPAVLSNVSPTSRVAQEEIFGPVPVVIPIENLEQAIQIANSVEYGLSAAICTNDLNQAYQFTEAIESGMVKVNGTTTGNTLNAPFGGWKNSSTASFRESGMEGLLFFTKTKTVFSSK